MFGPSTLLTHPIQFIVGFLALAVSIGIHEFSHVLAAYLQGDQTGKALGRLTLNPLAHLDPWGTIAIVVAGIGWGKPAPFNPYNLRFRRWGPVLVAIAGPISNVIMVMIAGYTLLLVGPQLSPSNLLFIFLRTMVFLNTALAVFNLIPINPLDGSHLLRALTSPDNALVVLLDRYGFILLMGLIFLFSDFLNAYLVGGIQVIFHLLGLQNLTSLL